jgi:Domain of unknown function (4846)
MSFKPLLFFFALISFACNNKAGSPSGLATNEQKAAKSLSTKNPFQTIDAILLPEGFVRIKADSNSFAGWLRTVPLKEDKTVYLFDGRPKHSQRAQFAVLDISVPHKNLQQCADAVMRLRAEYLFAMKQFDAINFTDNAHTAYTFHAPHTKENFMLYMERVFGMCGSASLSKQLKPVSDFSTIQPGDVLIRGGFPGHAVIVMDVAENAEGKKIFMLAQSYMPAQDIHLLVNPADENLSPWYKDDKAQKILTPEYLFYKTELKKW